MARLLMILGALVVVFTIATFVECALTERSRVRTLPKVAWLIIIVLFLPIGGVLWLMFGRPNQSKLPPPPVNVPDDDPRFLQGLTADERVKKLEEELAKLEDEEKGKGA